MKLQLALDDISMTQAFRLLEEIVYYVDIIEVGTPLVIREGIASIRELKSAFPQKEILADLKVMDAGYYETQLALQAGADYVTVLGVTDSQTIKDALRAASDYHKEIVVDMITIINTQSKIEQLENMGVQGIAVHTGVDQQAQGSTPLSDLREMCRYRKQVKVSVAGGITCDNIADYVKENPDIIIVGGGICGARNPIKAAKEIFCMIKRGENR